MTPGGAAVDMIFAGAESGLVTVMAVPVTPIVPGVVDVSHVRKMPFWSKKSPARGNSRTYPLLSGWNDARRCSELPGNVATFVVASM